MNWIDIVLWVGTDICAALALARLFLSGLARRYQCFAWMLAIILLRDVVLAFCRRDVSLAWPPMHLYTFAWMLTLVPALVAEGFAGVECYRRMASLYPKIGRFAPRLFGVCLGLSALVCVAGLRAETRHISGVEASFRISILILRWQTALECGGLTLAALFLAFFPPPMRRRPANVLLHVSLLALYFGAYAVTTLVKNALELGAALTVERCLFLFVSGLYLVWAIRMRAQGEAEERWPGLDKEVMNYIRRREQVARALIADLARSAGKN